MSSYVWHLTFELEKKLTGDLCEEKAAEVFPCREDRKGLKMIGCWSTVLKSPLIISQSTEKTHRAVYIDSFNRDVLNCYCSHYTHKHTGRSKHFLHCSLEFKFWIAGLNAGELELHLQNLSTTNMSSSIFRDCPPIVNSVKCQKIVQSVPSNFVQVAEAESSVFILCEDHAIMFTSPWHLCQLLSPQTVLTFLSVSSMCLMYVRGGRIVAAESVSTKVNWNG